MKENISFSPNEGRKMNIEMELASVCYVHSTSFLEELNSCASDFKYYISKLAHSIRLAATEIALGIVHRRTEALSHQKAMEESFGTTPKLKRELTRSSFRGATPHAMVGNNPYGSLDRQAQHHPMISAPAPTPWQDPRAIQDLEIKIHVDMGTPVIVVPREERSFEVIVANLGRIVMDNEIIAGPDLQNSPGSFPMLTERVDRIHVRVMDMNVHTLDLSEKYETYGSDSLNLLSHFRTLTSQELYRCNDNVALPILYDTAVDIRFDYITKKKDFPVKESESFNSFLFEESQTILNNENISNENLYQVQGKVVHPLKLSLFRNQYEQLLDSVKYMTTSLNDKAQFERQLPSRKVSEPAAPEKSPFVPLEGSFEVPKLILALKGNLMGHADKADTLVSLICQDFAMFFEKSDPQKTNFEIALKSLEMEDMQVDEDSRFRQLMTSITNVAKSKPGKKGAFANPNIMSSSCPTKSGHFPFDIINDQDDDSMSLPDRISMDNIYMDVPKPKRKQVINSDILFQDMDHPLTPPPSAVSSRASPVFSNAIRRDLQNSENLVHIKILNVDPNCPEFESKFNSTNRFARVDFNELDITFSLQTWVVVLDFFGIGSKPITPALDRADSRLLDTSNNISQKPFSTDIDIKVNCLTVTLNKAESEIARAGVHDYSSRINLRDGNFSIHGKLRDFSLQDLTSRGVMYKDRFLSKGENILTFHVFKYGEEDPQLEREYDALVRLRMASVVYVHTHRFYSEIMSFFIEFQQLQAVMNRVREAAAGGRVKELAERGSRIKLDVQAGSPLLLLPMCSHSDQLLAVDLGFLEIRNVFKFSGKEYKIDPLGQV